MRFQFGCRLFKCWRHHATWAAPRRPEINNDRDFGALNMTVKRGFGELDRAALK
jgi:hypothetical protein